MIQKQDYLPMTSTTQLLREILLEGKARTQSEIQQELEQHGISSSQPKISRLLHQIGAADSTIPMPCKESHRPGLLIVVWFSHQKTF